jgi:hypothetical protein
MSRPAKLSSADVDNIRRAKAAGARVADLAAQYGVSEVAIYNRLNGTRSRPRTAAPRPATRRTASTPGGEQRPYPQLHTGYIPHLCEQLRCGQPAQPGRPSLRLVVYGAEQPALEFCSWHCLSRHAIHHELNGADA